MNGLIDIHRRLMEVHGADAADVRAVKRWVHRFEGGDGNVEEKARSGRPHTATPQREKRDEVFLDQVFLVDRRRKMYGPFFFFMQEFKGLNRKTLRKNSE